MQKANFQLLAAAPELLEALQAVVRVADRKTDEFEMAHSAINKALGVILMNVIKEIPVMRDEYGCWT
ncbi:hypothetical protein FP796_005381, partial [Escherichia coli]|nr:hypothetical protein [Escherichia coli]